MATTDKYDRQLRLWGSSGQYALSSAHICVFNPLSAAACETLKNLILPGIGAYTVVGEAIDPLTGRPAVVDAGTNFFASGAEDESSGAAAIQAICRNLNELNPDVKGFSRVLEGSYADFLASPGCLSYADASSGGLPKPYTLVVAADLPPQTCLQLASLCAQQSVPVLFLRCYGLVGTVRLQSPPIDIVESKESEPVPDLRLRAAASGTFPELAALVDSAPFDDMSKLDDMEHAHVPYAVLLLRALSAYRATRDGAFPKTMQEQAAFRAMLKLQARDVNREANFEEAVANAFLAWKSDELHQEILDLCARPSATTLTPGISSSFDVLLSALSAFLSSNNNLPPLNGSIPDMTSTSEWYVRLQEVYHKKASQDLKAMVDLVAPRAAAVGLPPIPNDTVLTFCKCVRTLRSVSIRPLSAEASFDYTGEAGSSAQAGLQSVLYDLHAADPVQTPLYWYMAVRAADQFRDRSFGCAAGADGRRTPTESEGAEVHRLFEEIAAGMGIGDCGQPLVDAAAESEDGGGKTTKDICEEVVRWNNAEVHNVCAIVGGVAGQEAVKVLAKQFVPINNTYVYNGVSCTGAMYEF